MWCSSCSATRRNSTKCWQSYAGAKPVGVEHVRPDVPIDDANGRSMRRPYDETTEHFVNALKRFATANLLHLILAQNLAAMFQQGIGHLTHHAAFWREAVPEQHAALEQARRQIDKLT